MTAWKEGEKRHWLCRSGEAGMCGHALSLFCTGKSLSSSGKGRRILAGMAASWEGKEQEGGRLGRGTQLTMPYSLPPPPYHFFLPFLPPPPHTPWLWRRHLGRGKWWSDLACTHLTLTCLVTPPHPPSGGKGGGTMPGWEVRKKQGLLSDCTLHKRPHSKYAAWLLCALCYSLHDTHCRERDEKRQAVSFFLLSTSLNSLPVSMA